MATKQNIDLRHRLGQIVVLVEPAVCQRQHHLSPTRLERSRSGPGGFNVVLVLEVSRVDVATPIEPVLAHCQYPDPDGQLPFRRRPVPIEQRSPDHALAAQRVSGALLRHVGHDPLRLRLRIVVRAECIILHIVVTAGQSRLERLVPVVHLVVAKRGIMDSQQVEQLDHVRPFRDRRHQRRPHKVAREQEQRLALAALVELMLQCIQERREARGTADGLLLVLRIEVVHVVEVDDVEVALCRLLDKSSSDLVGQPHRHGQTIADWGRETCDQSRESGLIPAFKLVDFLVALEKLECRHAGHFVGLDEALIHVNESLESQSTPLLQ